VYYRYCITNSVLQLTRPYLNVHTGELITDGIQLNLQRLSSLHRNIDTEWRYEVSACPGRLIPRGTCSPPFDVKIRRVGDSDVVAKIHAGKEVT